MYKISRYTSYIEKNNVYAVYCNFNLYFFKNETYTWFKNIINQNNTSKIPKEFKDYLTSKEIISGDENV